MSKIKVFTKNVTPKNSKILFSKLQAYFLHNDFKIKLDMILAYISCCVKYEKVKKSCLGLQGAVWSNRFGQTDVKDTFWNRCSGIKHSSDSMWEIWRSVVVGQIWIGVRFLRAEPAIIEAEATDNINATVFYLLMINNI